MQHGNLHPHSALQFYTETVTEISGKEKLFIATSLNALATVPLQLHVLVSILPISLNMLKLTLHQLHFAKYGPYYQQVCFQLPFCMDVFHFDITSKCIKRSMSQAACITLHYDEMKMPPQGNLVSMIHPVLVHLQLHPCKDMYASNCTSG